MRADEMQIGAKLSNELWSFSIHDSQLDLDYMTLEPISEFMALSKSVMIAGDRGQNIVVFRLQSLQLKQWKKFYGYG